jgi:hypothetical protein
VRATLLRHSSQQSKEAVVGREWAGKGHGERLQSKRTQSYHARPIWQEFLQAQLMLLARQIDSLEL